MESVVAAPTKRWPLWAMVALILLTCSVLTPVLFSYRAWPFDSDEAAHAIKGLQAAADLRHGRAGTLIEDLYFHHWYPPLLSLYLSPFLAILGPTYWAARFPMLLLFLLNLALFYRVGRLFSERVAGGLAAALLGATSPVLWVHALLCMEEMLALTGLLLVVAGYVLWTRGWLAPRWTGAALALTFLARISLGAFAAVALALALGVGRRSVRAKARAALPLLGPLAVTALIWWAHPFKLEGLADYFLASAPGQSSITASLLAHHWVQLATMHTPGLLVGVLVVVSILLSLRRWRDPAVRFLLLLLLVLWGALVLKRQLAPRLFLPALVPAFLLAGLQAAALTGWLDRAAPGHPWLRPALVGGLGLYLAAVISLRVVTFPFVMEVALETDPRSDEARAWIIQNARTIPILLVNRWDQFSARTLNWYLAQQQWPHWEAGQVQGVDLQDPAEQPQALPDFQEAAMVPPHVTIVHVENAPVARAGIWWAYQASLAACWNGEWEAANGFQIRIWDGRMEQEVLGQPLHFLREQDREAARLSSWYLLDFQVKTATCD